MKKDTLDVAVTETERFLTHARELQKQVILLRREEPNTERFQHIDLTLAKWTAQVKRSSMDVTRALAALRQGR
jgi:hypothetical protein